VAAFVEYEPAGEPPPTHLAAMWELVPSQSDGWQHALAELRRFYDVVRTRPAPAAELTPADGPLALAAVNTPSEMCELSGGYIDSAQQLGRRTAELHLALAADTAEAAAFAPEPFTREDIMSVVARALGELRDVGGSLEPAVAQRIERSVRAFGEADRETLRFSVARTRIHGDFHLGQVLWSEGDFYLIDFEGEPARPLEERRRKDSPLKDVAGMLRSFNYAAYAALFESASGRTEDVDRLEPWARAWQTWVGAAFVRGYLSAAGKASFLPDDPVERERLLNLYLVEKALYELRYEMNNRPDWIRIPLRGLTELAG
jgi:trehalose synthase-fused probable maltokinase